jgi:hypothetical protein
MWIMMIKLLLEWSLYMLKRKAMLWERFSYQFFINRQRFSYRKWKVNKKTKKLIKLRKLKKNLKKLNNKKNWLN